MSETDHYQFEVCHHPGCKREATFITTLRGVLVCYCDEHGEALGLERGIPWTPSGITTTGEQPMTFVEWPIAEPERKCSVCQSPVETGSMCAFCTGAIEDQKNLANEPESV